MADWNPHRNQYRAMIQQAAQRYGIDPVLMEAIFDQETGHGTSYDFRRYWNPGGIGGPGEGPSRVYASPQDGFNAMASLIARRYGGANATPNMRMANRWVGMDQAHNADWVRNVNSLMNQIGGGNQSATQASYTQPATLGDNLPPMPSGSVSLPYSPGYAYDQTGGMPTWGEGQLPGSASFDSAPIDVTNPESGGATYGTPDWSSGYGATGGETSGAGSSWASNVPPNESMIPTPIEGSGYSNPAPNETMLPDWAANYVPGDLSNPVPIESEFATAPQDATFSMFTPAGTGSTSSPSYDPSFQSANTSMGPFEVSSALPYDPSQIQGASSYSSPYSPTYTGGNVGFTSSDLGGGGGFVDLPPMTHPFTASQYANLPSMFNYDFGNLYGSQPTFPSYAQYLAGWNPPGQGGSPAGYNFASADMPGSQHATSGHFSGHNQGGIIRNETRSYDFGGPVQSVPSPLQGYGKDTVPAALTPGEVVIPRPGDVPQTRRQKLIHMAMREKAKANPSPNPLGLRGYNSGGVIDNLDLGQNVVNGMIEPGNIDIYHRPVVHNPDGTVSTELSFSIGTDKGEVLIPRVINGRLVSQQDAINHYNQTGEHLGIFATPDQADAYAGALHNRQTNFYSGTNAQPGYGE